MADVTPNRTREIRGIYVGAGESQALVRARVERIINELEGKVPPHGNTCKQAAKLLRNIYGIQEVLDLDGTNTD